MLANARILANARKDLSIPLIVKSKMADSEWQGDKAYYLRSITFLRGYFQLKWATFTRTYCLITYLPTGGTIAARHLYLD